MVNSLIIPMEPAVSLQVPRGDYLYQVKWDGIRILAIGSSSGLRLQGKSGKEKTLLYPEFFTIPQLVHGDDFILDGEVIVLQEGKPCFYTLMQRESSASSAASLLACKLPACYMVFDLLSLSSRCLLNTPLVERQKILRSSLEEQGCVHVDRNFYDGEALLHSVEEKNMEGVVAKQVQSPYVPGPKKSRYWLKTKVERTLEAFVGGVSLKNKRPSSVLLGLEKEGEEILKNNGPAGKDAGAPLFFIGSVSSGLTAESLMAWYSLARANKKNDPPFENPPHLPGREIVYMEPLMKIKIGFAEWTPNFKLRAPRVKT